MTMIVWIVTRKVRTVTMTVRILKSIVWTVRLVTKIVARIIRLLSTLMAWKETGLDGHGHGHHYKCAWF